MYTNVERYGSNLLVTRKENGRTVREKVKYRPTLYTTFAKEGRSPDMELQNGTPLFAKKFDSMRKAKDYYEEYKEVSGVSVYGQDNFVWQYLSDEYLNYEGNFTFSDLTCHFIDIETTTENGFPSVADPEETITMISIVDKGTNKVLVFTNADPELPIKDDLNTNPYKKTEKLIEYEKEIGREVEVRVVLCEDESKLLENLINFWRINTPDIITGWNIEFFDIPYIVRRTEKLFGESHSSMFSPWGVVETKTAKQFNKTQYKCKFFGINIIDYLDLYKKFTYSDQNSFKLDNIARVELGYGKAQFEGLTFRESYENFWDEFVDYNIIDSDLVSRLDMKLNLLELISTMAYESLINYEDVFSSLRTWDSLIYNYLRKQGVMMENKPSFGGDSKIAGAYVKEPAYGKQNWVLSFDLASLYPHLIKQFNISPDTLVERAQFDYTVDGFLKQEYDLTAAKEMNCSITARGNLFTNEKRGFFPEMMEMLYNDRKKIKKQMLVALDEVEEIKRELHKRGLDG